MLAHLLALAVGSGSLVLYLTAFLFPTVHRKDDFLWSGFGFFYALALWLSADQMHGGLLMGQSAGVLLILWFGWQSLVLRYQLPPLDRRRPAPNPNQVKALVTEKGQQLNQKLQEGSLQEDVLARLAQQREAARAVVGQEKSIGQGEKGSPESVVASKSPPESSRKPLASAPNPVTVDVPVTTNISVGQPSESMGQAPGATAEADVSRQRLRVDDQGRVADREISATVPRFTGAPVAKLTKGRSQPIPEGKKSEPIAPPPDNLLGKAIVLKNWAFDLGKSFRKPKKKWDMVEIPPRPPSIPSRPQAPKPNTNPSGQPILSDQRDFPIPPSDPKGMAPPDPPRLDTTKMPVLPPKPQSQIEFEELEGDGYLTRSEILESADKVPKPFPPETLAEPIVADISPSGSSVLEENNAWGPEEEQAEGSIEAAGLEKTEPGLVKTEENQVFGINANSNPDVSSNTVQVSSEVKAKGELPDLDQAPEKQDPEIQDPEIQDPEIQDPEINAEIITLGVPIGEGLFPSEDQEMNAISDNGELEDSSLEPVFPEALEPVSSPRAPEKDEAESLLESPSQSETPDPMATELEVFPEPLELSQQAWAEEPQQAIAAVDFPMVEPSLAVPSSQSFTEPSGELEILELDETKTDETKMDEPETDKADLEGSPGGVELSFSFFDSPFDSPFDNPEDKGPVIE